PGRRTVVGANRLDLGVELGVAGLEQGRQRGIGQLARERVDLREALGLAEEGDELLGLPGDAPQADELGENYDPGHKREEQEDAQYHLRGGSRFAEEGQKGRLTGEIF